MADERLMKFRLGIVVVATALVAVTLVLLFGRVPAIFKSSYPIYVKFKDASGISPGTPVTKFGIRIGQVTEIGFADDGKSALVTLAIDSKIRLTTNETFSINKSMLGDAVIEVVRKAGALGRRASISLALQATRHSSPLIKVPQASTLNPGKTCAMINVAQAISPTCGSLANLIATRCPWSSPGTGPA